MNSNARSYYSQDYLVGGDIDDPHDIIVYFSLLFVSVYLKYFLNTRYTLNLMLHLLLDPDILRTNPRLWYSCFVESQFWKKAK